MQKELSAGRPVGRFANLYQEIVAANKGQQLQPAQEDPAAWLRAKSGRQPKVPRKWKKAHTILQGRRNRDRRPRATGILLINLDMDQQTMDRLHRALEVQHRLPAPIMVSSRGNGPSVIKLQRVRVLRIVQFSTR